MVSASSNGGGHVDFTRLYVWEEGHEQREDVQVMAHERPPAPLNNIEGTKQSAEVDGPTRGPAVHRVSRSKRIQRLVNERV